MQALIGLDLGERKPFALLSRDSFLIDRHALENRCAGKSLASTLPACQRSSPRGIWRGWCWGLPRIRTDQKAARCQSTAGLCAQL